MAPASAAHGEVRILCNELSHAIATVGRGVAVVFISHRLAEVREIADRVVVLRDGRNAGELFRDQPPGITHEAMVRLMVSVRWPTSGTSPTPRGGRTPFARPHSSNGGCSASRTSRPTDSSSRKKTRRSG